MNYNKNKYYSTNIIHTVILKKILNIISSYYMCHYVCSQLFEHVGKVI